MTDIAVVGIALRTDEVERGEKVVVKAFGNMAAAREKESVAARIATQAERQAVQAVEQAARAYSSAGVSSLEFTRALKQMGAVGPAVTEEINRNSAAARANAAAAKLAADAQRQTAEAVKTADVATTRATPGLKSLQTNLGSLAIAAGGLPGPLGRTAQALSTFALGGGPAVAIIAGISAIAYAYHEITEPARKAKEETEKLIDRLEQARKARLGIDLQEDVENLTKALVLANAEVRRLNTAPLVAISSGGGAYTGPAGRDDAAVAKAKAEAARVQRALDEAALARNTRLADDLNRDQAVIDEYEDRKRRKAQDAIDERLRRERKAGEEMAKIVKANLERIQLLIDGSVAKGAEGLTPSVRNQGVGQFSADEQNRQALLNRVRASPLLTPDAIGRTGKEVETRLSAAMDEAARNFERGMTSALEGVFTGADDWGQRFASALTGGIAGVLSGAISDEIGKAIKDYKKDFLALSPEKQKDLKAVAGGVGIGVGGFALGYSSGSATTGALGGAASGALAGSAIPGLGTVAGGIIGGVSGLVGGLLGSSRDAEKAAQDMREAQRAFGLSLQAFTDEATGGATTLSRNLARADADAAALKKQAREIFDSAVDNGAGSGAKRQAERDKLAESYRKVDEASQKLRVSIEAEEKVRLEMIALSLDEREARLAGNDRGALEARFAREEAEVQRQLRNGEITQAIATRTSAVITGELNKALADMAKEAEEAAKQIAETNASFATSLVGRELQARARLATSDAEREGIEDMIRAEQYRLEIEAAVKDGISETNIAALKRIQGLEEEAVAMERSKKAEEDRLRIIKESTAFLDDLKVREFRATGQGAAADEYAQRERDRQELIKAAEFGAEYVFETLRVQGLERADRDAQRRAQQEAAFGNSFGTTSTALLPDSRTSVNLAVGTSESTTNRLVGVMQSQLIHIQATASNTAEAAVLLRRIAASLDGGVTAIVDEGLAIAGSDADLGAGVVPGNR